MEKALAIRSHVNNTVYLREQSLDVKLTASFGIAAFPDHATDVTGLLAAADRILFTIKGRGKNAIGLAGVSQP